MATICVAVDTYVEIDDADFTEFGLETFWLDPKGYVVFKTKCKKVFLHKEIYKNINPKYEGIVDHEDNDKLNCKRNNLRPATNGQNRANSKLNSNNSSGIKGVHWKTNSSGNGCWYVQINVKGKKIYLGRFEEISQAEKAYKDAAEQYHREFGNPASI